MMLRLRSLAPVLLLGLLAATPAAGQRGGALSSFPLLRMEASARAAALGGAFSAVYDGDAGGLFYHPALPGPQTDDAISASYLNHLTDLNAGFLAYSRHLEGVGTASAGLRFLGYGEFEGYDEDGNETGAFGAADVALTLGLARSLAARLRYGANVHLVYGTIEAASASALAADVGVLYHLPAHQFTVSASVHHLGAPLDDYYQDGTTLPVDVRLGLSKQLAHLPLRLSAMGLNLHDLEQGPDDASAFAQVMRHLAVGAELEPVRALALRVGYGHRRHQELTGRDDGLDPAGLSAGFGLTIQDLSVDYAYSSWSTLGALHQFGLRAHL